MQVFSSSDAMAERLFTDKDGIAYVRITHWGRMAAESKGGKTGL